MREFFLNELKRHCQYIDTHRQEDGVKEVLYAYDRMCKMSLLARKEGLLALEEACEEMASQDNTYMLRKCMMLIVDGTEPELVKQIAYSKYCTFNLNGYEGLIWLMYIEGSLAIQAGYNPKVLEEMLKAMLPNVIETKVIQLEQEREQRKKQQKTETADPRIASLCSENTVIDEKDHSLVAETARTILKMGDRAIQKWIQSVDVGALALALKGLPGAARKPIFDNVSNRLATAIIDDMERIGPVRLIDVESGCIPIMKEAIRLNNRCEIMLGDLQVLNVVIELAEANR